jgi:hypothetical protein
MEENEMSALPDGIEVCYHIVNQNSGLPLEIENSSTSNGARAQQWAYGSGGSLDFEPRVIWKISPGILNKSNYLITNFNSGLPLEIEDSSTKDGAQCQQWTDSPARAGCEWNIKLLSGHLNDAPVPVYQIFNENSDLPLEIEDGSTENGAKCQQWGQDPSPRCSWYFKPVLALSGAGVISLLKSRFNPMQSTTNVNSYFPADEEYGTIDADKVEAIWGDSILNGHPYKAEVFDCDDFALIMKGAVAQWCYLNGKNIACLAGVAYGISPFTGAGHAFNWFVHPDLTLRLFEPQDGTWKDSLKEYSPFLLLY